LHRSNKNTSFYLCIFYVETMYILWIKKIKAGITLRFLITSRNPHLDKQRHNGNADKLHHH
jgi:hypothetical protein